MKDTHITIRTNSEELKKIKPKFSKVSMSKIIRILLSKLTRKDILEINKLK